jgi:hypothetical protein
MTSIDPRRWDPATSAASTTGNGTSASEADRLRDAIRQHRQAVGTAYHNDAFRAVAPANDDLWQHAAQERSDGHYDLPDGYWLTVQCADEGIVLDLWTDEDGEAVLVTSEGMMAEEWADWMRGRQ